MEKQIDVKGLTELNSVELNETNGGSPLTYWVFWTIGNMVRTPQDVQETGVNQVILFS